MNFQELQQFTVKTKLWSFINSYFRVFNAKEELIAYSQKAGFKLREDMRIYTDESMSEELVRISTGQIIDFGASYQVHDSKTGELLGSMKRSGFKSMARDHWTLMGPDGQVIYELQEDSLLLALVRRLLTNLVPASYHLMKDGAIAGPSFSQNFNPFLLHFKVDLKGWDEAIDKRLALAMTILLLSIEGKQGS